MKKYFTKTKTTQRLSVWRTLGLVAFLSFMSMQNGNAQNTTLRANQCGITLAALNTNINANVVPNYQMYRFEVSDGTTVNTFDTNRYNFNLTNIPGITYATTYSIRVAVQIGGVWGGYGSPCTVTTPTLTSNVVPTTVLQPVVCGATLASLDTRIGATPVYGAAGYRFEITTGGVTTIYDSSVYNFRLADAGVAAYGTTYTISVAALISGIYGNYGAPCTVTTPTLTSNVVPTTALLPAVCGTTLAALNTRIGTIPVFGATGYRFEITTGGVTTIYDSSVYNFRLADAGVAAYGTTYTIRVAALISGIYGNFGASCTVTTPTLTSNVVPTTALLPAVCGTTLAALNTRIGTIPVFGASGYRFEITTGGVTTIYNSSVYNFRLADAGVAAYSTTYTIRVAALISGIYGNFGAPCTVTTPAATMQYTTIPDPVFEAHLISLGLDSGAIDHRVLTSNIASVTDLSVPNSAITDLTGIRDFTSLQSLNCYYSNITALDVSGLTNLGSIESYYAYSLTNVNLTGCTSLYSINFNGCPITTISFAGLTSLYQVLMGDFIISEIDLSSCPNLYNIGIYSESLIKLNLSGLTSMSNSYMQAYGSNLTCIQVDDVSTAEQLSYDIQGTGLSQWVKPAGASFSTNCGFSPILKLSNSNNLFAVKAFPNPYDTAFNLNLETSSKENVTVAVYNMMGTLVESHQVNPMEVANLQLGSNFSTGIYNVIVSQGDNAKAVRLIKK